MKLGEALQRRADNTRRMSELQQRLQLSAIVQEGEKPPEQPAALIAELDRLAEATLTLIRAINRTNVVARVSTGETIADALAERDMLRALRGHLAAAADSASQAQARYIRSEIKLIRVIDPEVLRKRTDELARTIREIDIRIQAANWEVDLAE
jgi:hypothetical protein